MKLVTKFFSIHLSEAERREARRAVNKYYGFPLTIPKGADIPEELKNAHYRLCMCYEEPLTILLNPATGQLSFDKVIVND